MHDPTTLRVEKGSARTRTTWKSGAMQRGSGVRWFIVAPDGSRVITSDQIHRKGFGYLTRKAAEAAIAAIGEETS